ncbi:hypothetical protein G6F63_014849 [Rhizopus arrhizus]|nr:hypothetical protein G6F63_014849 [Rhizopus arrhizus]
MIEAFQEDGAVCVRQLFTPDEVALLTRGIESNLAAPSPRAKVASTADDPGWFFEDFCNWTENEDYRRFIFDSCVGSVAAQNPTRASRRRGIRTSPITTWKASRTAACGCGGILLHAIPRWSSWPDRIGGGG